LLFHLAAIVPTVKVDRNPLDAYEVNAIGAGRILEGMLRRNSKLWALYVSSSHVYSSDESSLREDSQLSPTSTYGRTKLAGELVAGDIFESKQEAVLCIARVFSMYSRDQDDSFLFPKLLSLRDASPSENLLTVRGWDNVRDFLHADDVAACLVNLALGRAVGRYNIGSGVGLTVANFATDVVGLEISTAESERSLEKTRLVADISKYERYLSGLGTISHGTYPNQ
jgi:nucleoside-diphosphate-sugar epimerase